MRQLSIAYALIAGAVFVALFRQYLPAKYSYDVTKIRRIALGLQETVDSNSYQRTGDFYGLLGLGQFPVAAGLLTYGLLVLVLIPLMFQPRVDALTASCVIILCGTLAIGSVYLGTYTKEVFVLLIVVVLVSGRAGIRSDAILVAAMLAYALFFRQYWYCVALNYVALSVLCRRTFSWQRIVLFMLGALLVYSLVFPAVLGSDLDSFREQVNASRNESVDAASAISVPIEDGGLLGSWLNSVVVLSYLLIPYDLALRGSPFYFVVALFLAFLWLCFWRKVYGSGQLVRTSMNSRPHAVKRRAMYMLASFVTVQAIFEPDYGSYLRHLAPLLAIFVYLLAQEEIARDESGEYSEEQIRSRASPPKNSVAKTKSGHRIR